MVSPSNLSSFNVGKYMVLCGKMEIVAGLPEGSRIRDELVDLSC